MKKQLTTGATSILRQDHRVIKKLFDKYDGTNDPEKKEEIIQAISLQLNLHMALEEELFYPAISKSFKDQKLLDQAKEWHHQINLLLDKLARVFADEDREEYDVLVDELKDCFASYIKTEEDLTTEKDHGRTLAMVGPRNRMQPEPNPK